MVGRVFGSSPPWLAQGLCAPTTPCLLLCCCRTLVTLAVHLGSQALWSGYSKSLRPSERRQWCNKIACGLHVGAARVPACCVVVDAGCCGMAHREMGQLQQRWHTLDGVQE